MMELNASQRRRMIAESSEKARRKAAFQGRFRQVVAEGIEIRAAVKLWAYCRKVFRQSR
jgi:hypothetical protein